MEWSEITRELFVMITGDLCSTSVWNGEHHREIVYITKGVRLKQIDNFLSCVSQYYVQDINA